MFNISAQVTETNDALKDIMDAMKELDSYDVLVGVPEDAAGRPDEGSIAANNAELMFIHTHGSPINNIPPRPVVEDAIEHDKEELAESLKKAIDVALTGKKDGIKPALERAGMHGQNISRAWFTNPANGWAPNNPATINAKGSDKPLIDTGELRKSITFEVNKKS